MALLQEVTTSAMFMRRKRVRTKNSQMRKRREKMPDMNLKDILSISRDMMVMTKLVSMLRS